MNREAWLEGAIVKLQDRVFGPVGVTIPKVKVSMGFPSRSALSRRRLRVGECWHRLASRDQIAQILISPILEAPVEVLATLAHEAIHAVYPDAGHRGAFVRLARAIGLEGKPTATVAGEALKTCLNGIVEELGPLPHAALVPNYRDKRQSTRLLKVLCERCGYIARVTRQWLDVGAPICPADMVAMVTNSAVEPA